MFRRLDWIVLALIVAAILATIWLLAFPRPGF